MGMIPISTGKVKYRADFTNDKHNPHTGQFAPAGGKIGKKVTGPGPGPYLPAGHPQAPRAKLPKDWAKKANKEQAKIKQ